MIEVVFETHATSEDNERGAASGWSPSRLSEAGRAQALALGRRRIGDAIDAVFSSDLRRAAETAELALGGSGIPILLDWRLRECDYGDLNGGPADPHVASRHLHLDAPYPHGESWREAVARVHRFLEDLPLRWNDRRVLVIGHVATRWAFDHHLNGVSLETLASSDFAWQEGWEYQLGAPEQGDG